MATSTASTIQPSVAPTASGVVVQPARLAAIVRDVYAGARYVDQEIAASALTEDTCPLTGRELDVLRYARLGRPVADIAASVHLAPGTVRDYLSSAMAKLHTSTRHEAARRAWAEDWI